MEDFGYLDLQHFPLPKTQTKPDQSTEPPKVSPQSRTLLDSWPSGKGPSTRGRFWGLFIDQQWLLWGLGVSLGWLVGLWRLELRDWLLSFGHKLLIVLVDPRFVIVLLILWWIMFFLLLVCGSWISWVYSIPLCCSFWLSIGETWGALQIVICSFSASLWENILCQSQILTKAVDGLVCRRTCLFMLSNVSWVKLKRFPCSQAKSHNERRTS